MAFKDGSSTSASRQQLISCSPNNGEDDDDDHIPNDDHDTDDDYVAGDDDRAILVNLGEGLISWSKNGEMPGWIVQHWKQA